MVARYKNLYIYNIEMYLTYSERKSIAVERFIKTLKNEIYDFKMKKCIY